MKIKRVHWLPAFGLAALLHLGLAAAMFWQWSPPGTIDAGMGGVEVALGPAGGPASEAAAPEEVPAEAPPPEAPSVPPPEQVEAVEEPPPPVVEATPVETAEPLPEPEPELVAVTEPVPREPPEPVEEPLPEPEPEPVAVTEAVPPEPAPEQVAAVEPVSEPRPDPGPVTTEAVPSRGVPGDAASADPAQTGTASGDASPGGGIPGAQADYAAILQAWLERHKEYPRRAQRRRQEGTALLYFVMDREGPVLDYRIEESSGFGLLDREVERMIERAQPLPPMPEEMQQARLELKVPVQFFLR